MESILALHFRQTVVRHFRVCKRIGADARIPKSLLLLFRLVMLFFLSRVAVRCGCGEIGIRGGLKIHWGFPRCRFESDQPHQMLRFSKSSFAFSAKLFAQ